jgi:hypothetical protein
MWIQHLFSLIGTTIRIFFDAIGSTLLGKLVDCAFAGAVGFVILLKVRKKSGLRAMIQHLLNQYGDPLKFALWCALIVYGPIYIWSVGKAVYEDHQGLVASLRKERNAIGLDAAILQKTTESLNMQLNECGIKMAALEGVDQTLTNQNRDQLNTIDNCQTQAIKLLQPQPFQWQAKALEEAEVSNNDPGKLKQRWILLANKDVSPAEFRIDCSRSLLGVEVKVAGTSASVKVAHVLGDQWGAQVLSPAWGPNSPILVISTLAKTPVVDTTCQFHLDTVVR